MAIRRHDSADFADVLPPRTPQPDSSPSSTRSGLQLLQPDGGRVPSQTRSAGGSCLSLRSNRISNGKVLHTARSEPSVPENAPTDDEVTHEQNPGETGADWESNRVPGDQESGQGSSSSSMVSLNSDQGQSGPENASELAETASHGSSIGCLDETESRSHVSDGSGDRQLGLESQAESPGPAACGVAPGQLGLESQAESPGPAANGVAPGQLGLESPAEAPGPQLPDKETSAEDYTAAQSTPKTPRRSGPIRSFLRRMNCFKPTTTDGGTDFIGSKATVSSSGYGSISRQSSRHSLTSKFFNADPNNETPNTEGPDALRSTAVTPEVPESTV